MIVKNFEKKVIKQLCERDVPAELLDKIFDCKVDSYDYTGAGYYLTFKNNKLSATRKVFRTPILMGEANGIQSGFVVFIERHRLILECHAWGEIIIPADFRERSVTIKAINTVTKFTLRKPPKGWMFPLNKKVVRSFINKTDSATFDLVEFKGTHNISESVLDVTWCWFGVLKSERVDEQWHFSLSIDCLKEAYVLPWKEEIPRLILAEVKQWVENKVALPVTAAEKPTQLFLKYEIKQGACRSACHEVD